MTNQLVKLKLKNRLNKLDSDDFDNIPNWQIAEAVNKAQREWTRRNLKGINQTKTGKEVTTHNQADFQFLLKTWTVPFTNQGDYFESSTFPTDYLVFSRVGAKAAKNNCCPPRKLKIYNGEESDVDMDTIASGRSPSYKFGETFYTLFGNTVRIYTNSEFDIVDPFVNYYRKPANIVFAGSVDPESGGTIATTDTLLEYKDEVIELILAEAAAILSGDLDRPDNSQRLQNDTEHSS